MDAMAASASGGGDAGPSTAQQKVDSKILWHFGLMPTDGSASSGGVVTRVLHVDAREDRLVEIMDARISRVIALDDLVSYDEEEDEDADEDISFVDEDEAATRTRERATVSLRVRRGAPFVSEVEDIEYRLQSVPDARALRVVLARLSRGHTLEDETAEASADALVPGLDARLLRAGTLMRRVGRVALSDAETAAGRGGGRWTTCAALCVPGKLILLAKQPSVPEPLDERPGDARESLRSERAPAPAVATGGRASPLAIHFAASLADARVVSRAPRWNAGGGGEFDLVFGGGRLVLAAPRGGRRERDAWAEALRRAAAVGAETPTRDFGDAFSFSAALDPATRAILAEAKRVAGAMRLDFGDARSVTEDARLGDASASAPERVLVLDRFWRSAALGVGAHFLFNFSAEVVPETVPGGANGRARRRKRRVLLHVDVERDAVDLYVDPRVRGRGRDQSGGLGSLGRSRPAVTRSVETKDVTTETSGPRELTLRAAGFGSFPRGAVFGRFAFQTAADREVFASLTNDLRRGAYKSADHYQYRALLKRGAETGVSKTESDVAPARFLVLVPGKLLVLRGDRAGVPLATASLAEGAEVTVLERTKRNAEGSEGSDVPEGSETEGEGKNASLASAVVALTLPNGDAFAFRFATLDVAKSWARALAEATVEPVAEDAAGNTNAFARAFGEAEGAAPSRESARREKAPDADSEPDSPDSALSPTGVPASPAAPSPPATPREADAPPSPRRRARAAKALVVDAATRDADARAEVSSAEGTARGRGLDPTRHRAETEARESFAQAEARAEARLATEYAAQAASVRAELEAAARARAGVEAAARARAEAQAELLAAEQARALAEARESARAFSEAKAEEARVRASAEARAEAEALAEAEAAARAEAEAAAREAIEAEERAAARALVESERAAIARVQDEEDAVRRVRSENEFRLAVRARVEAEERERAALETRAREKVRARLEAERALEAEKASRALENERAAMGVARIAAEAREAQRSEEAERVARLLAEAERRAAAAEQAAARSEAARAQAAARAEAATRRAAAEQAAAAQERQRVAAEWQEKETSRARADALAAEVAAAVMAGADPFAATRANSVASPGSARDSPYTPSAAARRLDAYGALRGSPPEAPPYVVGVSDSAETTPFASPSALRDNSAPPSPPGRMHDAFFSLGARSEPAGPSPPESPPPSIAPRFEPAAGQAAQRPPFPSRAADLGLGAREHPEDDVGAENGVGPAAETRGRAANRDRRASTSSSSSDSSSSSRSSSPDAAEARHSHPGVSLPQKEIVSPVERAALYDAEESEPPTPTQDLAFLVGATLGGARARGSEAAGAPAEAEAAAASAAKRAAAAEAAAPAAAPGTPDWSRLVDENLERRGAGEGGSSVAAAAPPPEASAALRALWRTDFEASSFADPPPAPAAPAAAPPARGDRSPSSPSAAPPTHFLAAAAARASSTRQVAPPSPKRKQPQHPRAAPPPPPPPPAPGPVNKRKKSMIKSMFKGMFSSSSGGGKKKRDKDNKK
jgi:hypothetical protein